MIEKVAYKAKLSQLNEVRQNLEFWLSKSPSERILAVEHLRKQYGGVTKGLQRVFRVLERAPR